ncbi:hypothetical protein BMR06_08115 [Methylococcaceae bacterium HT5]|nr:hypothetical protein BMR06_08115 [Methylococcaceae bacterium HT5]
MDIQKLRCAPVIGGVRCQNGEIMKLTESESEAKLKLSLLNLSVMGLDSNAAYLSINILT